MKRRSFLKLIPVFIIYVIIFRFLYLENGFSSIMNICIPIFFGLFIAVILNPIVIFFETKFNIKYRSISILITYTLFLGFICSIVVVIAPSIIDNTWKFIKDIPRLINSANKLLVEFSQNYEFTPATQEIYKITHQYILDYAQKLTTVLTSFLNLAIGKVINIFAAIWNLILASNYLVFQ